MTEQRIAIIDIGSNSIRLVIYERTNAGAHRVIEGSKRPARLSEHIDAEGRLSQEAINRLVETLNHFRMICSHHRTYTIRAVATAAVRNAVNRIYILDTLEREAGLRIELLSGEEEARYGFLGMANSLNIRDGYLIDIGGGSTEISLFRNRELIRSVSFPFGCVNLTKRFMEKGMMGDAQLRALEAVVEEAVHREKWITVSHGLPLVAVGGTARAFAKIHQAKRQYPFQLTHNYSISDQAADQLFTVLRSLPLEKRKKFPGLSKDRLDLIVPGLAVLRAVFRVCRASEYLICGAGLRDGLFFASRFKERPLLDNVLEYSANNLVALHPEAPLQHVNHVNAMSLKLFDALVSQYPFPERARIWIDTASMLFRIGASIDYYHYASHTFYLIVNSRLNGVSHRETILIAAVASYKNKSRTRKQLALYRQLLDDKDLNIIYRLGMILQLAIAMDRSETQSLKRFGAELSGDMLLLKPLLVSGSIELERKEVAAFADDFEKVWGLCPSLLTS